MAPQSLLDLPVEILDNILSQAKQLSTSDDSFKRLHPFLLLNRLISSKAAKFLYQTPWKFLPGTERGHQLISTLVSSASGKTTLPYHLYIEQFRCERCLHDCTGNTTDLADCLTWLWYSPNTWLFWIPYRGMMIWC